MAEEYKITADGHRLVKAWQDALKHLEDRRRDTSIAESHLCDAEKELSKWMLPEDATVGEKIAVWVEDALVQVEKVVPGEPQRITVRRRGRSIA